MRMVDAPPVSGSALVAAAAPTGPYRAAPHLLDLPRSAFLDSSLTDARGGGYSFFQRDPFLTVRKRGRRVELTGPAGRAVAEEGPWRGLPLLLRRYTLGRGGGLPPFLRGAVG